MELAGRVAIVTGGASGIGRATALALAREGVRVVIADRDARGAAGTAEAARAAGGEARASGCDVSDVAQVAAVIALAERQFGGLDLLFNNAGIATGLPAFPETPLDRWQRALSVNLLAVILGTQLAIPALRRRGGGAIVNTSSMAAISGLEIDPVYAAGKAGVLAFTRSLTTLWPQEHIRVNCICPGVVDTPFVHAAEDPRLSAMHGQFPSLSPEEVAQSVLGLMRDETAAGQALIVSASRPRAIWTPL